MSETTDKDNLVPPSEIVLDEAERINTALGHENFGFLSREYGFVPKEPPLLKLPPEFSAWDNVAADISHLYKTVRLRKVIKKLPMLDASEEALPDIFLLRAALLLSTFAHGYCWSEFGHPEDPPSSILVPWQLVCERLKRKEMTLGFADEYLYNWRFKNPDNPSRDSDNIEILVDFYDRIEDTFFDLAVINMTIEAAPIVNYVVETQKAILKDDIFQVKKCLSGIADSLRNSNQVFSEITQMRYSKKSFNPIIWARSNATIAHPIFKKALGGGGGGSPVIQLMDVFLGREKYDTVLGEQEKAFIDQAATLHVSNFLSAVNKISLKKFVFHCNDKELMGLYTNLIELFGGDNGFLGTHRKKALGFLEAGMKAGKIQTTGRFEAEVMNVFTSKPWNYIYNQFKMAVAERFDAVPFEYPQVQCKHNPSNADREILSFNLEGTGVDCRAGDQIQMLPKNSEDLVKKVILSLSADGSEIIELSKTWRNHLAHISKPEKSSGKIDLFTFLTLAHIRPVTKETLSKLFQLSREATLGEILEMGSYQDWELQDIINLIKPHHYHLKRLLIAPVGHKENLSAILPPLRFRTYSISATSKVSSVKDALQSSEILVKALQYPSRVKLTGASELQYGVSSNYLLKTEGDDHSGIPIISRATHHFKLPPQQNATIIMFAAGTGVAAFRAFIDEYRAKKRTGKLYLFLTIPTENAILAFREQILEWINSLDLQIFLSCTREFSLITVETVGSRKELVPHKKLNAHIDVIMEDPEISSMLWKYLSTDDKADNVAYFYICGEVGFYKTVYNCLIKIVKENDQSGRVDSRGIPTLLYELYGNHRMVDELYTSYYDSALLENKISVSELVLRNSEENGYWMLIEDRVHDVTDFLNLHLGGHISISNNAGVDATASFEGVEHHLSETIRSRLNMYLIGQLEKIKFQPIWSCAVIKGKLHYLSLTEFYDHWVKVLFQCVEMQNSAINMFDYFRIISSEWKESPSELLFYNMQSTSENHRAFMSIYLNPLLDSLSQLWTMTVSLCSPAGRLYTLQNQYAELMKSQNFKNIQEISETLFTWTHTLDINSLSEPEQNNFKSLLNSIARLDQAFLADIKALLRQGILVFEEHPDSSLEEFGRALESILNSTPLVLDTFNRNLAGEIDSLL